jgi:hypothetical protein
MWRSCWRWRFRTWPSVSAASRCGGLVQPRFGKALAVNLCVFTRRRCGGSAFPKREELSRIRWWDHEYTRESYRYFALSGFDPSLNGGAPGAEFGHVRTEMKG